MANRGYYLLKLMYFFLCWNKATFIFYFTELLYSASSVQFNKSLEYMLTGKLTFIGLYLILDMYLLYWILIMSLYYFAGPFLYLPGMPQSQLHLFEYILVMQHLIHKICSIKTVLWNIILERLFYWRKVLQRRILGPTQHPILHF